MSTETIRLFRDGGDEVWRWGKREIIYLSLYCHHQNDTCIKMGSDESHFNVSVGSCWKNKMKKALGSCYGSCDTWHVFFIVKSCLPPLTVAQEDFILDKHYRWNAQYCIFMCSVQAVILMKCSLLYFCVSSAGCGIDETFSIVFPCVQCRLYRWCR